MLLRIGTKGQSLELVGHGYSVLMGQIRLFTCLLVCVTQVDRAIVLCSEMHNIKEAIYENKKKLEGIGEDYQFQVGAWHPSLPFLFLCLFSFCFPSLLLFYPFSEITFF